MAPDAPVDVFVHARALFDGFSRREGDGLLVRDGRVVDVGTRGNLAAAGATVVDFGDAVIVPGFVDAHTHVTIRPGEGDQHGQIVKPAVWQTIRGVENLRRMLASGVTTAKIMTEEHDIDFEFRDAIARGETAGPRLRVAGPGLSPPGGHGSAAGGVAGVGPLREAVRARAERGADHIKIFTTGGVSSVNSSLAESNYSGEEIAAIVRSAAEYGLKVSSHAHGGPGVDLAVANGIHSIEHGALLDEGNIAAMATAGTWLTFTQTILFHPSGIEQGDAQVPAIMAKVREARAYVEGNVGRVRASGIPMALGTDSMHGLFGYELQWLVEHGWSPLEALVAGTRHGGELIGDPDIGVLRPGAHADFVVLRRDPFADITAVFDVEAVYRAGRRAVSGDGAVSAVAAAGR
ncbi:amidohydrolase family protein [Rugosimonospora africana]|uniref:Xaa-Pro dipeptidase n=1 Tax=Rugosimonospora africana TaxID=556532 RepID=A0A8J3VWU3_9ACTN|nr:amidohydrolase family protein [Rugosimonospora africana]GIH21206.1 Xaa-Pro dipeptidase [Rugosimonospora africana]